MRKSTGYLIVFFTLCFAGGPFLSQAQNNDHMFPAADAAKKYIDYDRQGFIINGKKEFIVSAGLEYARIPHQLWRDRLLRLKRAGFNCIEIYTFWNFHEPVEGKFDFAGDHDLDAFLKLVKQMDMYAIARVGPYYCAEWDLGGYPIWLRFKPGMMLRQPNKPFEDCVSNFFDKLLPIVANNQISKGGAVILVQLENEHPEGKGTYMPNSYFTFLQKKAVDLGIQVPYFFSEVHHGSDPAGIRDRPFDNDKRPNPWMSTEFWSVWYSNYGSTQADADTYGRRTWKVIRDGGGGYNYYMAHGGSNFGYTNDDEDAASYDYGAAVGQTGDLRPIYYQFKRNALFASSFQSILANAGDASASFKGMALDTAFRISGRHSDNGDIAFLDNPGKKEIAGKILIDGKQLPAKGNLQLSPGEIMPIVQKFELAPGIMMDWGVTRILGISTTGHIKTMVIYGEAGSAAALSFTAKTGTLTIAAGKEAFEISGNSTILTPVFDAVKPNVYLLKLGGETVRIIALNPLLADRTWFVRMRQQEYIITGPEFVGDVSVNKGELSFNTEHFWQQTTTLPVWVFDANGQMSAAKSINPANGTHAYGLAFTKPWQYLDAGQPANPAFNDRQWLKSADAAQMGIDGDLSCYAWYRSTMVVPQTDNYILKVREGGDRYIVYVDNVKTATLERKKETPFLLTAGKHSLAIFTSHAGRDKFFNHIGEAFHKDAKGLSGPVYLQNGKTAYLDNWQTLMAKSARDAEQAVPSFDGAQAYKVNDDIFKNHLGFAWFQTEIPLRNGQAPQSLFCRGFNDALILFVNGKQVLSKMKTESFNLSLQGLFKPGEKNTLTIFVDHNRTYYRGGLTNNVEVVYSNPADVQLSGWAMRGGPGNQAALTGWKPLASLSGDRPAFLKNNFIVDDKPGVHTMWRVTYEGLSRGSIWVNGHNLGRYPEKINVKSLYIPECWLIKGENTIVVFDEDGNRPNNIAIIAEKAASRDDVWYSYR